MMDCIFCKIANGTIKTEILYEDEKVVAFRDINPVAPVHVLIVPKKHIESALKLEGEDFNLIGHVFMVAKKLANELGIAEDGFRIVNNCNRAGGQTVMHIHFHLLGGRDMQWPPG
ncbi:histidine triad nucleotide-binding protein [Caloramator sp. CAR-1]|uniref:histidine triad nucleotide-binding protein n=1 Tax=Caloramator sp. CAR-1 TaxID=3062777 RepID=UPI0026E35F80|nr:histidine triad nucleotide-binding protein [Caloramator sp. CAR-1]MDO6354477.1 histidine triad nucleotide-binding protein [Caloramator sp. CAR-1]